MKAQKLGLILGINMVAACLMMQGCKATRPGGSVPPQPPPPNKPVISVTPAAPRPAPAAVSGTPVTEVQPIAPTTPPPATVQPAQPVEPPPSAVRTIKPLPPAPAPKAPKTKVAAAPAPATAAQPAAAAEYVVKPGDTLFLISKRTNYRQAAIVAANPGLNPDRLRVGQKLKMPGAVAAPAVATAAFQAAV